VFIRRKPNRPPSEAPLAPVPSRCSIDCLQGPLTPDELEAAVRRFKKAIIERALGGELTHHLGYPRGDQARGHHSSSQRRQQQDGSDRRGPLPIEIPGDREGTCEPRLIGEHDRGAAPEDHQDPRAFPRMPTRRST
jgi:hypothetical protein